MIVILGGTNDKHGELSAISHARLEKGIEIATEHPTYLLTCTGGKGPFNTTGKPHALYAKNYLTGRGILPERIVALIESKNTVEDAKLLKPVVKKFTPRELIVVTSDFHMPRAMYIFERVFLEIPLSFSKAPTPATRDEYDQLSQEEQRKLEWLHEHGLE